MHEPHGTTGRSQYQYGAKGSLFLAFFHLLLVRVHFSEADESTRFCRTTQQSEVFFRLADLCFMLLDWLSCQRLARHSEPSAHHQPHWFLPLLFR